MPELPEVETVRLQLLNKIKNKTFLKPIVYYRNLIKTDIDEYIKGIENTTILDINRTGKFLIFDLSNNKKLLFHLRMEGKLFVVDKNNYDKKHLSLLIPFRDDSALAFYDVRKFGVSYLLNKNEKGPLSDIALDPLKLNDFSYLYNEYSKYNKPIKELLLDQKILSGIGNIYADEILFDCKISPFKKGKDITINECENILSSAKKILTLAIENNGSTVKSYKASQHVNGSFQQFLKVYSKEGQYCQNCHTFKIKKRKLNGRGTSYCPKCQNTGYTLCLTGKIASGKSEVLKILKEYGFITFSADEVIRNMYLDKAILKVLQKEFPYLFINNELSKEKIFEYLTNDKSFNRKYLNFIYKELKIKINSFIVENDKVNKAFEIPRVFDAKMENMFDFIVGVESKNQKENLFKREKSIKRLSFNDLNSYDKHKDELYYIIHNDFDFTHLKNEIDNMIKKINKLY